MEIPISDYRTDLKTVLDNCIRILLFMADIAKEKNILDTLLNIFYSNDSARSMDI